MQILICFYDVTSLVHSYIVITVFLSLVSGLLSVQPGTSWSNSIHVSFCVRILSHVTA